MRNIKGVIAFFVAYIIASSNIYLMNLSGQEYRLLPNEEGNYKTYDAGLFAGDDSSEGLNGNLVKVFEIFLREYPALCVNDFEIFALLKPLRCVCVQFSELFSMRRP